MRVLVTGGSGFIGSNLCWRLSHQNQTVTIVRDLFPTETPWGRWLSQALSKTTIVLGDILNLNLLRRVIAEHRIDAVAHLAAQAIVSTAQKDPASTYMTNVQGTVNVLEACRQLDVKKVLLMGTDKIYPEKLDITPDESLTSGEIYATSKACAVLAAESYAKTYGLKIATPIASNCYGYDLAPRIVSNTIRSCLRNEPPIIFRGEEKTMRQYIYIEDLTDALTKLIEENHTGRFNVAVNPPLTQEQVVLKILTNFPHLKPKYIERQKPIKEIQLQSLKPSDFGWKPKYTFEAGIKETIAKFKRYGF